MGKGVVVTADKVHNRKRLSRIIKISLLALLLFLVVTYIILRIIYNEGFFTVNLTENKELTNSIAIYEFSDQPQGRRKLNAQEIEFMDNISIKWLPDNLNTVAEGSHNGENYIAYSFYIENQGKDIVNYWYKVVIDDVIKNVDDAVRLMIYVDNQKTVYAKPSATTNEPENGTTSFRDDSDGTIILEQIKDFIPEEINKITIVMWLEGDDPECVNDIIGGQLKLHMDITEEHIKK